MKAEKAPLWPLFFGLLVLLIIIAAIVQDASPKLKTAEEQQDLLQAHEGILYFIDAEIMAKELCPNPSLRWSHDLTDDRTGCVFLGNGVWYASGLITGQVGHLPDPPNWEVFFLPDERKPLFVRVGSFATGDDQAALRQAKGAPGEK